MALIRRSDEKNFIIFSNSVSFGQGDPVPHPASKFSPRISAIPMTRPDWGWGRRQVPPAMPPVATLLRMRTVDGMDNGIAKALLSVCCIHENSRQYSDYSHVDKGKSD